MRDPEPVRLGNLASNLARLSSFAPREARHDTVKDLLRETGWFIEWAGPEASPAAQAQLVELQVELARWSRRWEGLRGDGAVKAQLARICRARADQVMELSGLLEG
jgi:hypothetical protein